MEGVKRTRKSGRGGGKAKVWGGRSLHHTALSSSLPTSFRKRSTWHLTPRCTTSDPRDSPPFHQPALTPTIHYLTPNFHPTPTMHHSASATQPASSTTHHLRTIHEPATAVHHPALTNRAGPGAIRRPTATHPSCIRLFIANTTLTKHRHTAKMPIGPTFTPQPRICHLPVTYSWSNSCPSVFNNDPSTYHPFAHSPRIWVSVNLPSICC